MAFQLDDINKTTSFSTDKANFESILSKEVISFKKPFSNKIKEDFYTELAVLLRAGINLREALELIKNSQKNKKTIFALENIIKRIIAGKSLSDTINIEKGFSDYEYHSIRIGEETGTIVKTAAQLGDFFKRKNEQRKQLINALTYPCIILGTAVLVIIFMLQFVVPMFEDIFKQQNVELPAITVFVVNISGFIKDNGWSIVLLILILLSSRIFLNKKSWYKRIKDNCVLKVPFIGNFSKTIYLSQFAQAIALLSASKVPIVDSINLVKKMIDFYPLTNALENVEQQLLKGDSLSLSLSGHSLFDEKMIALVKVAEETNQTEFMFDRLNMKYSSQVQQSSKLLSTVMEPVLIMLVGLFVGFILIAMYLPMFELSSILG